MKRIISVLIALSILAISCKEEETVITQEGFIPTEGIIDQHAPYIDQVSISLNTDGGYYYDNKYYLDGTSITVSEDSYEFTEPGYHVLTQIYTNKNGEYVDTVTKRFVIQNSKRPEGEWGLKSFTPQIPYFVDYTGTDLAVIHYKNKTDLVHIPFAVLAKNGDELRDDFAKVKYDGGKSGTMKMGVFGGLITESGSVSYSVGSISNDIHLEDAEMPVQTFPATVTEDITVPKNSIVKITDSTTIADGVTVTVEEGALFVVSNLKQIVVNGSLLINASAENPVLFAPEAGKCWSGLVNNGRVDAKGAIFSGCQGSGAGMAGRLAVIDAHSAEISIDNCYFINNKASIIAATETDVVIQNSLFVNQDAGIRVNGGSFEFDKSIIVNVYQDAFGYTELDCDAIQLANVDATVSGSKFFFIADDAISCGTRDEGASVEIENTYLGYCVHEGVKTLSDAGTGDITVSESELFECGQAVELGGASAANKITVSNSKLYRNLIGVRYGESDKVDVSGTIELNNTAIIDSYDKPVWNMVRATWKPKIEKIIIENSTANQTAENYPELND